MERKIFTDNLPKRRTTTSWENSVGYEVPFIYDDIKGVVKIVDYNKGELYIKYKDKNIYRISTANFIGCKIGNYIKAGFGKKFKYEIGYKVINKNINMTLINRFRVKNKHNIYTTKKYNYICNICGYQGEITETYVGKTNCACCNNRVVVDGINSIYDTDRWMIDLGISVEDAKTHTKSSNDKIKVKCPFCGKEKMMIISSIYTYKSISCICGDGVSYPEKFMSNILKQLDVNFETEYSPDWIKPKRYDFYIPSLNCIIETHGMQHYGKTFSSYGGRTLKEEQANDKLKEKIAKENDVEDYIVIDCRKSELEWIKNSVINSKLNELFDLNEIDWLKCEEFALSNLIKKVCKLWNSGEFNTTTELSNHTHLTKATVWRYLKKGSIIGATDYCAEDEADKIIKENANKNKKPVEVFKNDISLGVFDSCSELQNKSVDIFGKFLYSSEMCRVCNGIKKSYKGFTFKYICEYTEPLKVGNRKGKQVEVFKDGVSLGVFDSCNSLARNSEDILGVKLSISKISLVCNGKRKTHKGFTFKYIE